MSSHSHSHSPSPGSNRRQIELDLELDSTLSPLDALASHTRKLTIKSNHHQQQQQHRHLPPKHQHSLPPITTTNTSSSPSNYPSSPYYSRSPSSLYSNVNPSSSQPSSFNRPSLHSLIIPNHQQNHTSPTNQPTLLSPHFNHHKPEDIRNSTATFATDSTDYVWDRDDEDEDEEPSELPNGHQDYHQALPPSMLRRPSEGMVNRSRAVAEEPTERISSVYGEQESVTDENASSDLHAALHVGEDQDGEEALEVLGSSTYPQQTRSYDRHSQRSEAYEEEDEEDEDEEDEGAHSIRYESGQSLSSMNPFQYSHYESSRIPTTTAIKPVNFPTIKTHQALTHNSTLITNNAQQDRSQNFNDHHHHHHQEQQQSQDMLQTPISLRGSSSQSGLPSHVNTHERVRNFSRPLRPSTIVKVAETDLPTPPPSRQISPSDARPPSQTGRTRASTTTSRSSIQSSSSSNGTRRSWKNPFSKRRPESLLSNPNEEEQANADRRIHDCYDAVDRITRANQTHLEHHSTPSITFNQPAYTEEANRALHYDYHGSGDHQEQYDTRHFQPSSASSHYEHDRDSGSAYDMAYQGLGKGPSSKGKVDHRLSIYSLPKGDLSIEHRLSKDRYMSRSPISSIRNSPRSQSPIQDSSSIRHQPTPSRNIRQSQLPPAMAKAKASLANLQVGGSSNGVAKNRSAEDYLQLGIDAHERGEMERSAGFFERSAREGGGCGTGMLMWGLALRHGWGCQVNESRAFKWLQKAAESVVDEVERVKAEGKDEAFAVKNELVLAVYELGQCFMRGWGCKKDKALAINYFELAAKLGDPDAQQELGFCYSNGKGTKKDLKKAAKYYRMASKQGIEMMGSQWIWKAKYD